MRLKPSDVVVASEAKPSHAHSMRSLAMLGMTPGSDCFAPKGLSQ
jgi:hypothetical protein